MALHVYRLESEENTPCQTKITAFDLPSEDHSDGK